MASCISYTTKDEDPQESGTKERTHTPRLSNNKDGREEQRTKKNNGNGLWIDFNIVSNEWMRAALLLIFIKVITRS